MTKIRFLAVTTLLSLPLAALLAMCVPAVAAEPIVVLHDNHRGRVIDADKSNRFLADPDFTTTHRVKKNETLFIILNRYYGRQGFDRSVLGLAVVKKNPHAFARGNGNFLFAGKVLRLPSVNEMRDMVFVGQKSSAPTTGGRSKEIYFHGF